MNNPQIHQHSNPSKFNTDKSLLPSGIPSHGGRESGQALFILLAFIIAITIGFIFGYLSPSALAIANDNKTGQALAQAKDALIGWAVSQPGVTVTDMPGLLPYPDRNADGNYDGHSDCPPSTISNNLLIGKLPFLGDQASPCQSTQRDTMALDKVDGAGERLWYAVSANLLRAPSVTPNIPANLSNTSGWLTVHDATGAVLSNLVAFIVIAPGNALPGQDRSGAAPNPNNYLDSYTVGATTYSNYDTATLNFIMAQDTTRVPAGSNQFNDRLLYVTRDEFRIAIANRVAAELKLVLNQYHSNWAHPFYPNAAPAADGECVGGTTSGYIPLQDAVPTYCMGGPLTGLPSWFADWEGYVSYTRNNWDSATLTIFGKSFDVTP